MTLCENFEIQYLPPVPVVRKRRASGGDRGARGAYWAAINAHVSTFLRDEHKALRYAFNGAAYGLAVPSPPTRLWTPGGYSRWLDRFARHCETCPGGDRCTALSAAREMVQCR